MTRCPAGTNKDCEGCEFSKEGKCDWPYRQGMTYEEIKQISKSQVGEVKL